VTPGQWMMVTFVIDSRPSEQWPDGYISVYKNGVLRGGPVSIGQFHVEPGASDAPFRIGTRDLESFFKGAIGKVAVYDSVLSGKDILAAYNAMFQP
jgi:Concanavalin A-like lectin/glucanases superfamily